MEKGRAARPDLHLGVCGEHGGDPDSIHFFDEVGLDYVSCSPFRVPVARLEAGRVGDRAATPPEALQELERVELVDRDDPDAGQPRRERLHVVLQVDDARGRAR